VQSAFTFTSNEPAEFRHWVAATTHGPPHRLRREELPIRLRQTAAVATLPPHHRDPFDRMLVAQAMIDGLTLVARDEAFLLYRTPLIRA
jgi:PIN domain nuclease of toxin-antitoxin system